MMALPLKLRDPKRTADVFPNTELHGERVLGFDERHKEFVEVKPQEVREKPRVYRFWTECLRRRNDVPTQEDRRNRRK